MNDKTYPKWSGVVLGFLLAGSAHFLSGERLAGVRWYLTVLFTGIAGNLLLAVPGIPAFAISLTLIVLTLVLWLIMLKQSYRPVRRIKVRGWLVILILSFMLNALWETALFQIVCPFRVPTQSMVPTLKPGDHLMAERISYWFGKPERGDIVIFNTRGLNHIHLPSDTYYIRRIAGLPGETVQISPPNLVINGEVVKSPAIFGELSSRSNGFTLAQAMIKPTPLLSSAQDKVILGENEYFTLGDNTTSSLDSRYYGAISGNQIFGKISRIYWPITRSFD